MLLQQRGPQYAAQELELRERALRAAVAPGGAAHGTDLKALRRLGETYFRIGYLKEVGYLEELKKVLKGQREGVTDSEKAALEAEVDERYDGAEKLGKKLLAVAKPEPEMWEAQAEAAGLLFALLTSKASTAARRGDERLSIRLKGDAEDHAKSGLRLADRYEHPPGRMVSRLAKILGQSLKDMAKACKGEKRSDYMHEAVALFRRAIPAGEHAYGADHGSSGVNHLYLAQSLVSLEEWKGADEQYRIAHTIFAKLQGDSAWVRQITQERDEVKAKLRSLA